MIFIDITKLNELQEEFKLYKQDNEDFQGFAEKRAVDEHAVIDTKPCIKFLQQMLEENHRYLMRCEDEDLRWFGNEHVNRVNFLKQLLGEKDRISMQEIKAERKRLRVGFELIELKAQADCFEFIIRNIISNRIINWGYMPEINVIKEYLNKNDFPEDRLYCKEQFLNNIGCLSGFIHLKVEKRQTAEFICKMIYELS